MSPIPPTHPQRTFTPFSHQALHADPYQRDHCQRLIAQSKFLTGANCKLDVVWQMFFLNGAVDCQTVHSLKHFCSYKNWNSCRKILIRLFVSYIFKHLRSG